jgi:hypothetical protein
VNRVRCCPQREMAAENLGSEDTENPEILWPGPLAHSNLYEAESGVSQESCHKSWSWQNGQNERKDRHG